MERASLSFDKRKHPRIAVEIPVKYKIINQTEAALALLEQKKAVQTGNSQNVSVEGLFLVGGHRLAQGDILKIEVPLPDEGAPVRAFAEVIWSRDEGLPPGRHGAGIFFMALRDEDAVKMRKFVDRELSQEA